MPAVPAEIIIPVYYNKGIYFKIVKENLKKKKCFIPFFEHR